MPGEFICNNCVLFDHMNFAKARDLSCCGICHIRGLKLSATGTCFMQIISGYTLMNNEMQQAVTGQNLANIAQLITSCVCVLALPALNPYALSFE